MRGGAANCRGGQPCPRGGDGVRFTEQVGSAPRVWRCPAGWGRAAEACPGSGRRGSSARPRPRPRPPLRLSMQVLAGRGGRGGPQQQLGRSGRRNEEAGGGSLRALPCRTGKRTPQPGPPHPPPASRRSWGWARGLLSCKAGGGRSRERTRGHCVRHPVRSVSAPCRPRRDPGRAGVASRGAHSHASSCSATSSVLGALPPPSPGRPAGMGTVSALTALGAAQWRADQEPEGHQTIKHEQCFIYRSGLIETKRPELASPPPAASPEQSKVREGL